MLSEQRSLCGCNSSDFFFVGLMTMEPQDLVDTSSMLRGIGHQAERTCQVRRWVPKSHVSPWEYAARWQESVAKPRATRNPALGAEYMLETPFAGGYTDALVDTRPSTEIIGEPTRYGARIACRTPQK